MSIDIKTIPVKTWQFHNACKILLGMTSLTKLFKISPRQIDRWACDPDFTESSQRNPMDRYEALLKKLIEIGSFDMARRAVDRQARIVGCKLITTDIVPDKDTILEELLDNLPVLAEYQEAIRSNKPIETIRSLHRKLINELDEDLVLIEQERAGR
ncbi:MAG: hypothetical protein KAJ62_11710 [Desulfobacteraceae bacterium]|nr:hypothetical protein [Desulfobacteraceae bacterium]